MLTVAPCSRRDDTNDAESYLNDAARLINTNQLSEQQRMISKFYQHMYLRHQNKPTFLSKLIANGNACSLGLYRRIN